MMISTRGRYALHVMADLAQHIDEGPISLKDIALRQQLSVKYLESIVAILNKANMLQSFRGKVGGYCLSKRPEEYTIQSILELTEGSLAPVGCVEGGCPNSTGCITMPLWKNLDSVIENYLESVTLKDLIDGSVNVPVLK
ncbi:MAG: Rrf2 family transcriptional regulator [Clostridia bacterium]|nr:Rrf2 family transcriptional regulator [Clostridia bacterium]